MRMADCDGIATPLLSFTIFRTDISRNMPTAFPFDVAVAKMLSAFNAVLSVSSTVNLSSTKPPFC